MSTGTGLGTITTVGPRFSGSNFSGFDGGDQGFGKWQRNLATKIAIDDTDWNPIVS
mgnify:CR=1 FL=1